MNTNNLVLLPGLDKQLKFIENRLTISEMKILIIGSGTANVAKILAEVNEVEIIVEDYDSLMSTKLELDGYNKINVKMMDFERTDYDNDLFDLIYAQGSVSDYRRKNIIKELKRILKKDCYLSVGEVVKLQETVPTFIEDIFEASSLEPLYKHELTKYYTDRNFELMDYLSLSKTLKEYYSANLELLNKTQDKLNSKEKSYNKKILSKISHESKAYLKLGADKFIGFETLLLKKK